MLTQDDVKIQTLGKCDRRSPLNLSTVVGDGVVNFVPDTDRMPLVVETRQSRGQGREVLFEKAGPRERIFCDPAQTKAAVVTCGGLCPGLNNVIRSIFLELHHRYGVEEVIGIRYGYMGLGPDSILEPLVLTPRIVEDIHKEGGTILGSSRGPIDPAVAVEFLRSRGINLLFCIGGDGTQHGALKIAAEAKRQDYVLGVVGIPKTIDNDIQYVSRTFGYFTAIDEARNVINCAHTEAKGAPNGVTVVKLMGRDAGFIAAGATIVSQDVNFTLVPEVPFALEGATGLLNLVQERLKSRGHAVVVVAEGAGQDLMPKGETRRDRSGNLLHQDIGRFVTAALKDHFKGQDIAANVRYIDPSYIIRSVPANCEDALLCDQLARNAVHAAMAGKTEVLIGYWYDVFIHVPIIEAISRKKTMEPECELWRGALAATGQPVRIV